MARAPDKNRKAAVGSSPGLQHMAFPFVRVAARPTKPRETGLTIVADRGIGLNRVADLLDSAAEFVDFAKIAIGAYRLQSEAFVQRKIALFREKDVRVFFAGDVTEAAFLQGVSKDFYREVKRLGGDAVEVSSAQVSMSIDDKCKLIRMAKDEGLQVIAEAGQKGHDDWTRGRGFVFQQIEAYFKTGAWKVLIQGEGVSEGVDALKEELVLEIAARFDVKDLIFQAKDGVTQSWYVTTLGNQVNLDVDDDQVIDLELMRRNIRKRGVFGLVGSLDPA
jgi:phosphosulfolactate synthase